VGVCESLGVSVFRQGVEVCWGVDVCEWLEMSVFRACEEKAQLVAGRVFSNKKRPFVVIKLKI